MKFIVFVMILLNGQVLDKAPLEEFATLDECLVRADELTAAVVVYADIIRPRVLAAGGNQVGIVCEPGKLPL